MSDLQALRALLAEAAEVLNAWVDPRHCSQEEADWHGDVLARIKAEIATPAPDAAKEETE